MNRTNNKKTEPASAWEDALAQSGISPTEAAILVLELVQGAGVTRLRGNALLRRCRDVISMGSEARKAARSSVGFARAAESSIREREGRRSRTLREIRNICSRLLREIPGLAQKRVRSIGSIECRRMIDQVFPTPRQRAKARIILHGIFAHCRRQGWCDTNPVEALPAPRLKECEISPLPWNSIRRLIRRAQDAQHRPCMAALGLMLWAGVRPAEVERLDWQDIDWEELVICVRPRHSKTGGARHITLQAVLAEWLKEAGIRESGSICPRNWRRRWLQLRHAAGIVPWQQDVLRHTFASYFIKQWRSYEKLQVEMGHRSANLLRTRYLSMKGVTREQSAQFWRVKGLW